MVTAKAISLSVRPVQSADLCFPIGGIIEDQPDNLLGQNVRAFNRAALVNRLEPNAALPLNPNEGITLERGRSIISVIEQLESPVVVAVLYGPDRIDREIGGNVLSRLRAADLANQLVQAVSWYELKSSADLTDEAVEARRSLLGRNANDPGSLSRLLDNLSSLVRNRGEAIQRLYEANGPDDVQNQTTTSETKSKTTGGQSFDTTSSTGTTYFGRDYRYPWMDNRIDHLRADIALRQERLAARRLMAVQTPRSLSFERAMTASEVRKIQISYLDTFLVAPFDGVITGVFRNLGEFVSAGQPVLRLENDTKVYLVGTIKCRGLVHIGDTAKVTTTLFGEPGSPLVEIEGTVSAVRGHESVDEQWDVLIRCNNIKNGTRILPLNYNFDFDSTEIEITP
jgi:hypothetical protein